MFGRLATLAHGLRASSDSSANRGGIIQRESDNQARSSVTEARLTIPTTPRPSAH